MRLHKGLREYTLSRQELIFNLRANKNLHDLFIISPLQLLYDFFQLREENLIWTCIKNCERSDKLQQFHVLLVVNPLCYYHNASSPYHQLYISYEKLRRNSVLVTHDQIYLGLLHNQEINPFHPNTSIHILHTVLYTFAKVLFHSLVFLTILFMLTCCLWAKFCLISKPKSYLFYTTM